tara:strand:+ start:56 stop:487 length:432 start_codon:yes stop_codon:yes gene_type:complete
MVDLPALLSIGSEVKIIISRLESGRLPVEILESLKSDPRAVVIDYKMTDGCGIGYILKFNDGSISWFFDYEIESNSPVLASNKEVNLVQTYNNITTSPAKESQSILGLNINIDTPQKDVKDILRLINPVNFVLWLIFSLKDVF